MKERRKSKRKIHGEEHLSGKGKGKRLSKG